MQELKYLLEPYLYILKMWGTPHFLGWGICEVSFFQTTGSTVFVTLKVPNLEH